MLELFSWVQDLLAVIGGIAVVAVFAVLYFWYKDPKNVELMVSQVLRVLSFLGTSAKKWQIKFSLQGDIGRHIRDLEKDTGEYAPYDLSIHWIPENTERMSFLRGQTVIARMSYDENPHLNYLTAVLLYMKQGFLPSGRQFLPPHIRRAMDLAAINLLLERVGNRATQGVFTEEILPSELGPEDGAKVPYLHFLDMEEFGLFSKLFLPEVYEYGIRERVGGPRCRHMEELSQFVRWLRDLASDMEHRIQTEFQFAGDSMRVEVIPVGMWGKIVEEGIRPYVTAVEYSRNHNVHTVYLIARGRSRKIIPEIRDAVQRMGLCRVDDTWNFRSRLPGTEDRIEATICRLSIIK